MLAYTEAVRIAELVDGTTMMRSPGAFLRAGTIVLLAVLLAGCPTSRFEHAGFLEDYSRLGPDPRGTGAEVYVKEPFVLRDYDSVILDSVQIWYSPRDQYAGIDPNELKEVTDYFRARAVEALQDRYPVVEEPGPGVLRVRAAITGIKPRPQQPAIGANTPATYVQAKLRQSAGRRFSVLEAALEAEIRDSQSGELLAAFVDQRSGDPPGGAVSPSWQQIQGVLDFWADRLRLTMDAHHREP